MIHLIASKEVWWSLVEKAALDCSKWCSRADHWWSVDMEASMQDQSRSTDPMLMWVWWVWCNLFALSFLAILVLGRTQWSAQGCSGDLSCDPSHTTKQAAVVSMWFHIPAPAFPPTYLFVQHCGETAQCSSEPCCQHSGLCFAAQLQKFSWGLVILQYSKHT